MKRAAGALAVAVVIGTVASGTSRAAPIAPLAGVQTQSNSVMQIYWNHHGWYPHRWRAYPYWIWGAYPSRHYWDPRAYWGRERWGW